MVSSSKYDIAVCVYTIPSRITACGKSNIEKRAMILNIYIYIYAVASDSNSRWTGRGYKRTRIYF